MNPSYTSVPLPCLPAARRIHYRQFALSRAAMLFVASALLACTRASFAIDNANVLVLFNNADPNSASIAAYYAQVHPGARTLGLNNVPVGEQVTQDIYRTTIRPQVLAGLTNSTDVIVTTKGLPLRIYNDRTPASFPFNYTDPQGVPRTIYSDSYKRYSSFEGELSRIDRFSSWVQMGDQTWWHPTTPNPSRNPYFKRDAAFSHADSVNEQLRLTARLDGYTVADVKGSIDRAQRAFRVPFGQTVVVDDSPAAASANITAMSALVNDVLSPSRQGMLYDNNVAPVTTSASPVIGYVSHGTNDGSGQLPADYMRSKLRFTLARGAIAHTWESFNGSTFVEGASHAQGSMADWIRAGGTAAIAQVEEPGAGLNYMTNEDRLFQMMLDGYSFVEAAWNATPQVSYVNTVIGDPLLKWRDWIPGDANLDGYVNNSDFLELQNNWFRSVSFDHGDFNGDGLVDTADYHILKENWLVSYIGDPARPNLAPAMPVPEPSTIAFLLAGLAFTARPSRKQR